MSRFYSNLEKCIKKANVLDQNGYFDQASGFDQQAIQAILGILRSGGNQGTQPGGQEAQPVQEATSENPLQELGNYGENFLPNIFEMIKGFKPFDNYEDVLGQNQLSSANQLKETLVGQLSNGINSLGLEDKDAKTLTSEILTNVQNSAEQLFASVKNEIGPLTKEFLKINPRELLKIVNFDKFSETQKMDKFAMPWWTEKALEATLVGRIGLKIADIADGVADKIEEKVNRIKDRRRGRGELGDPTSGKHPAHRGVTWLTKTIGWLILIFFVIILFSRLGEAKTTKPLEDSKTVQDIYGDYGKQNAIPNDWSQVPGLVERK